MKTRLLVVSTILLSALLVLSIFRIFALNQQIQKLENQLQSDEELSLQPTKVPTATPNSTLKDFENELVNVFSGTAIYQQSDNSLTNDGVNLSSAKLETYLSKDFELGYADGQYHALVRAYKYTPGLKYENGYEGGRWVIDMDKWVSFLTKSKLGRQFGIVYDDYWGETNQYEKEYDVTLLGNRKFVISDLFFQPAASWDYQYQTYDTKNKQIIIVTLTFYDVYKGDNISNLSEVKNIFSQIETVISQLD